MLPSTDRLQPVPLRRSWRCYLCLAVVACAAVRADGPRRPAAPTAEGVQLSEGVRLLETPGHTPQDITTLVDTEAGVAALTHLWVYEGAGEDRLATDPDLLEKHRTRVLGLATIIVPGHGPMYPVR